MHERMHHLCLTHDCMNVAGPGGVANELNSARQLAFVVTDMESSTAMADASTHAFSRLQEIHDAVWALAASNALTHRDRPSCLPVFQQISTYDIDDRCPASQDGVCL